MRDYSKFDAYLDIPDIPANDAWHLRFPDGIPLTYYGGERRHTKVLSLEAPKVDTGANPAEIRSGYGEFFSQESFENGQYQRYFHHTGRDPERFLRSEGLDFSEGRVRHLYDFSSVSLGGSGFTAAGGGKFAHTQEHLFILASQSEVRRISAVGGAVTIQDFLAGEAATDAYDVTSNGNDVFVAAGSAGVHASLAGAAWAHWKPDGINNLVFQTTQDARLVRYVKQRVMVAGDAGRGMYEVVNVHNPARIGNLLPAGWVFTDIGENGQYIYATAVHAFSGLSRVYHYGLNDAGTAIEEKGSSPINIGTTFYSIVGHEGMLWLGGGERNDDDGFDPVFYMGIPSDSGFLNLVKIAEEPGAGVHNLSVKALCPTGKGILIGWSTSASNPYGPREGLALYDIAREAFFHSYGQTEDIITPRQVAGITVYKGVVHWSPSNTFYVDPLQGYTHEAYVISSIADFVRASEKTWDLIEISCKPVPPDSAFDVYYTTAPPEEDDWTLVGSLTTVGAEGASFRLTGVSSRLFALKVASRTGVMIGTDNVSPELRGWSVRATSKSNPVQWVIERSVVLAEALRSSAGKESFMVVDERLADLQDLYEEWATLYERHVTYDVHLTGGFETIDPTIPITNASGGDVTDLAHVVKLTMVGEKI